MNVHPGVHEKNRNLHRPVHPGVHGSLLFRNPLCRNGLRDMYKRKERGLIKTSCPVPKPKKSKKVTPENRKKVRRNVRVKFLKKHKSAAEVSAQAGQAKIWKCGTGAKGRRSTQHTRIPVNAQMRRYYGAHRGRKLPAKGQQSATFMAAPARVHSGKNMNFPRKYHN